MQVPMGEGELRNPASVEQYVHLLRCPGCYCELCILDGLLQCGNCGSEFPVEDGIPLLEWPRGVAGTRKTLTQRIRSFYEDHPFPDYEEFDDLGSLLEKARRGVFARLLDEQIPFGVRILECGCGTGQLCNFLGIARRTVFGTDISLSSLRLAEAFRRHHRLSHVFFLQVNLFYPVFPVGSFDYVICNGVLHHTLDPQAGFNLLAGLLRPGGHLVVGLYHRYGRLITDLRRQIFKVAGTRLAFLDPRLRERSLGEVRRAAWFADQYQNPHESKHTVAEVMRWLDEAGLRFVKSVPKTRLLGRFTPDEALFEDEPPGSAPERFLKEVGMVFRFDQEGGFFTVIARKEP